mmetsp:Transcript_62720/g.70207  ORF Transcript_62720/g.70207 Transcript_62720/m.70207 type:complete len:655 (-) Transcript_62720:198-2162(-)
MGTLFQLFILLLATKVSIRSTAFVTQRAYSSASGRNIVCQLSSSPPPSGSSSDEVWVRNKARTDIRNFLTQRSIQSFVYLVKECREEHTSRWLEKTLDFANIEKFHGTGAFNQTTFPEWDSIFLNYMDRPDELIVIQIGQRRRQRKLSGYNPYFESLSPSSSSSATKDKLPSPWIFSKKKPQSQYVPKKFNRRGQLPGPNNYLESLSCLSSKSSQNDKLLEIKERKKKKKEKPNEGNKNKKNDVVSKTNSDNTATSSGTSNYVKKEIHSNKHHVISSGNKRWSTSYLETLPSTSSLSSSAAGKSSDNVSRKQSNELSNNPYLEEKSREYELYIEPSALVRRILSVREQLSNEWVEDLDTLVKLNDEILDTFEEYTKAATCKDLEEDNNDNDDDDDDTNMKIKSEVDQKDETVKGNSSDDLDLLLKAFGNPDAKKDALSDDINSSSSLCERLSSSNSNTDNKGEEKRIFDRNILFSWSQSLCSPNRSSSPYRKANFDLLLLLATQESIHRVLNSYKEDDEVRPETFEWLLDFYKNHVKDHFDGHQTYARSEDFLEKMLTSPRTLIETNDEILAWVDPARVAKDIIRERSEVALDWMSISETISDEHTDLRRLLFTNLVSKSLPDETLTDTIHKAVTKIVEEEGSTSSSTVFGAFE